MLWGEDTGTQTGTPLKGTTRTTNVTDVNWKNSGVQGDAYSAYPITAGNNSFDKWQYGYTTGAFNQLSAGLFAHTATAFGSNLTLKGVPAYTTARTYRTPATTANADLSVDMTSVIAIGSGVAVGFGETGPEVVDKAATETVNPAYTNWLATQLQTAVGAAAGDTAQVTLTLEFQEN
jgi:hypothetical protein